MAQTLSDAQIAAYKKKEATAVQTRYADWLIEKLELEFPNPKAEAAFREAVRIATALRMIFQASPENQGARAESRTAEAKGGKKSKGNAAPGADDDSDNGDDETPAPKAKRGRPAKAQAKASKPPVDDEDADDDTPVQTTAKPKPPRKAARSGAAAPF